MIDRGMLIGEKRFNVSSLMLEFLKLRILTFSILLLQIASLSSESSDRCSLSFCVISPLRTGILQYSIIYLIQICKQSLLFVALKVSFIKVSIVLFFYRSLSYIDYMFKIKIQLFALHFPQTIQQPFTIKLKKDHWHYILTDKITTPIISVKHQFLLREDQERDTCFQLQLLIKTSQQKARIVGCAIINIKEWPFERTKRDNLSFYPQIWLDLSIHYEYVILKTPSQSELDVSLGQIEYEQEMKEKKQLNSFIKRSNIDLQVQLQYLQNKNQQLIQKKQQKVNRLNKLEQNHIQAKRRIEMDRQKIDSQIIQAKLIVSNLVNIINQSGVVDVVQDLNEFLINKFSRQ